MTKRRVFIDGYNVIRRDPLLLRLEDTSMELARDTLLARINSSPSFRHDDVTVVFDGGKSHLAGVRPTSRQFRRGRVQVIFSPPGQTADEVIKRMVAASPPGCLVITNDNEIRNAAKAEGAKIANMAPRTPPKPNAAPRYTNGTTVKEDDYQSDNRSGKKGNGRKAPRKRNRQDDLPWY